MAQRLALLAILLVPLASGHAEEPVAFRECAFEWIPWASTLQEARAQAKRQRKPILAFVLPWDGKAFESGYEGAEQVRAGAPAVPPSELQAQQRRDPGFIKEQAMLAVLLGNPHLSALVARSFVPVRLRMHTWHFFDGGPGPYTDPLPALGTSTRQTRPPALLVATPEGKLLHRIERMGVFDPYLTHGMLLALLRKYPRLRPTGPREGTDFRMAVAELAAGGALDDARLRLSHPPSGDEDWAVVMRARLDASEGSLDEAEASLRALPASAGRDALLAEIMVRRGRHDEVAALQGLAEDPEGRVALAYALGRLGRTDEARTLWRRTLEASPDGALAARARLHLAADGPRAREWETLVAQGTDPLAQDTVSGSGGEIAAVRYLLTQQDPDGSWKDPSGPGGPNDLSVPRTALCVCALRAWRKTVTQAGLDEAIARGTTYVDRWSDAPSTQVWSLTYALHMQLDLFAETKADGTRRRATALLESLGRIEHDGGWTYTAPPRLHTFNTAPILLLLVRARELGFVVPAAQIDRAARFLERNRVPKSRVFHYGPTMEHMSGEKGSTDTKSTCMRSAVCELALLASGREKDVRGVAEAIDLYFEHQESARATQKIFESYVDVTNLQDSYRYFFGTWYTAQGILRLPEPKRKKLAPKLAQLIRAAQEIDGSFVDSQSVGKSSSTAIALLALAELRPAPP